MVAASLLRSARTEERKVVESEEMERTLVETPRVGNSSRNRENRVPVEDHLIVMQNLPEIKGLEEKEGVGDRSLLA